MLKRLKVKLKPGRPKHDWQGSCITEDFKVDFKGLDSQPCCFLDELRYRARSKPKRRWAPQGIDPACKVKLSGQRASLDLCLYPLTGH